MKRDDYNAQTDMSIPKLRRPRRSETSIATAARNAIMLHRLGIFIDLSQAKTDEAKAAMLNHARRAAEDRYTATQRAVWIFWRQNTGAAPMKGRGGREQMVRFSLPGSADFTGFVWPSGRWCNLEMKAPGGRSAPHQAALKALAEAGGAAFGIAFSAQEAVDFIAKIVRPSDA